MPTSCLRFLHAAILAPALAAGCAHSPPPSVAAAPPLATKPGVGREVAAAADNKLQITFSNGSTTLTPEDQAKLDVAARLFRDVNPVEMFSTGYSDTTGDEYGNLLLSARRAEAVKQGLMARGIPADRVKLQALGESELANKSDPTAAENRRVVIQWRVL